MAAEKNLHQNKPDKSRKKLSPAESIKRSSFSPAQLSIMVVVFAIVGVFAIWQTFAQGLQPSVSISSNPGHIHPGQSSTISWTSSNATSCYAYGGDWGIGPRPTSGSEVVSPSASGSYDISCHNGDNRDYGSAYVYVDPWPPTVSLSANPTTITKGKGSYLTWNSANASSCSTNWAGAVAKSGSAFVKPASTTTYSISCSGPGGTTSDSAKVTVNAPPPPSAKVPGAPSLNSATSGNYRISLKWSPPSSNGGSAITGYRIYRAKSSGAEVLLTSIGNSTSYTDTAVTAGTRYYYKVSAVNSVGTGAKSNEKSAVPTGSSSAPKPIVKLAASPSSIPNNGYSYLQWSSSFASSCSATWTSKHTSVGTQRVGRLKSSKTYTISCSGSGGTTTASAKVTVAAAACTTDCPEPVAPPPPNQDLEPPVQESEQSPSTNNANQQSSKKPINWLRNFILGGILGELIGLIKQ